MPAHLGMREPKDKVDAPDQDMPDHAMPDHEMVWRQCCEGNGHGRGQRDKAGTAAAVSRPPAYGD